MTTGNTVAMTVSVAAAAPGYDKNDCEELQAQNEKQRENSRKNLKKALKDKDLSNTEREALQDALDKVESGGATFSSAKVDVGVAGSRRRLRGRPTASSSGKAQEKNNAMVGGGTSDMKTGKESAMCKPPTFKHPEGGAGAHGETKILNEMTQNLNSTTPPSTMQGGKMLLNIDWRYTLPSTGKTYRSGMPCRTCFKALCHAAVHCKIDIFICDEKNQPTPLKDHCKNKKKGYLALDQKVDNQRGVREFRHGRGES